MIWAWLGALMVGLTLGLLGSGGSILTVPVLVYLVGEPGKLAIAESLGIVALISGGGAVSFIHGRRVSWLHVLFFGGPAMLGAYSGAYLSAFMPVTMQLGLFAMVVLLAAGLMLRPLTPDAPEGATPHARWKIGLEGLAIGVLTGLVGVGGGFLIVPSLVVLSGLSMHRAVGTSLVLITLNATSGFLKHLDLLPYSPDWHLMLIFGAVGIVGSYAGGKAGRYVPQARLKKVFAVFLVMMGLFILWNNLGAPQG